MRGQKVVRTLMLTPWIVPSYVVAVLWGFMWQSDVGIVNKVLVDYTHLLSDRPVWLLGPHTMWAIIIPSVWRGLPFAMLIFLAGLQALPKELYEAAAIDGAGALRRFRYITLPLMRPLIAHPAAVRRHLLRLPVRDPVRDARQQPGRRTPT